MKSLKLCGKLISGFFFIFVIPLLFITNILYIISQDIIQESTINYIEFYTNHINYMIDKLIEDLDNMTRTTFDDPDILAFLKNDTSYSITDKIDKKRLIERQFLKLVTQKPTLNLIILVSKRENIYNIPSFDISINPEVLFNQTWYQQIKNSNGEFIITPAHAQDYIDKDYDKLVFSVGRLLRDYNGDSIGVILFDINAKDLVDLGKIQYTLQEAYDTRLIITTKTNEIIADTNNKPFTSTGEMQKLLESEKQYVIINELHHSGLKVIISFSKEKLFEKINIFRSAIVWITIISIVFITFFIILFSLYITKPIRILKNSIQLIKKERYSIIPDLKRSCELGDLIKIYNMMVLKIKKLIEKIHAAEKKQEQLKLIALQNQINPHLLYNTIELICMKTVINQENEIVYMLKTLAKKFKPILSENNTQNYIKDEVEFVNAYIQLVNFKNKNHYLINFEINEQILNSQIIKLIFQPIVENSIIHGFADKKKNCLITITGQIVNSSILLTFEDNGKGIHDSDLKKINHYLFSHSNNTYNKKSLGLKNILERIKLKYGKKFYIKIFSTYKMGTKVDVLIPKRQVDS